jgi:hypothetical protein
VCWEGKNMKYAKGKGILDEEDHDHFSWHVNELAILLCPKISLLEKWK